MKVSELSEKSGVPLPTIKFYIREGLLPKGASTGKNQAEYGAFHLERLALIRALKDDAGLGIDAIGRVLHAADTAREEYVLAAIDAIKTPGESADESGAEFDASRTAVLDHAAKYGWRVTAKDLSVREAARALVAISHAFPEYVGGPLDTYFDAVEGIAKHEIPEDFVAEGHDEASLRYALLGTLLFEPFILAIRRMAHVAHSRANLERSRPPAKKKRK